jgi:hypothetical protein
MRKALIRFPFAFWCGWVIVQAPYVGKEGKSDADRPIYQWDLAPVSNRPGFFYDTVKECEERAKMLIARPSICVPVDWVKPHRPWWQFWK